MSYINLSPNLFLGSYELKAFQSFLSEEGFRKHTVKASSSFGLIKYPNSLNFTNGKVEQDVDNEAGNKTIKVAKIEAIDSNGNYLSREIERQIEIPQQNTWYWIKTKYTNTSIEDGTFSIDIDGNLSGVGGNLMKIFRGQPNFPTRIKFISEINQGEYDVLEVVDNNNAKIVGYFQAETGLKIKIVGTFTPGTTQSEGEKYPFRKDYATIEIVEEVVKNTKPTHLVGEEFFLARIRWSENQLVIQDKRTSIWTLIDDQSYKLGSFFEENKLFGIEACKYTEPTTFNDRNIVEMAWGMRSSNWSIDSNTNKVTLFGSSKGGRFKTIDNFTDGDFDGWRLYTENGNYSKVISSIKSGSAINLSIDALDVNDYLSDGSIEIIDQQLLVVPDCEEVQISITGEPGYELSNRIYSFPVNTPVAVMLLELNNTEISTYRVKYRHLINKNYSSWFNPLSDEIGYYKESSFDSSGALDLDRVINVPYNVKENEEGWLKLYPHSYGVQHYKTKIDRLTQVSENFIMGDDFEFRTLIPGVNSRYQLLLTGNCVNSKDKDQYINLDTISAVSGDMFVFVLSKKVAIGEKTLNITYGYSNLSSTGTIIKTISERDFGLADHVDNGVAVYVIFDGVSWYCWQDYQLTPKNEVTLVNVDINDRTFFDSSGLGVGNGWLGYAICNGKNGTDIITGAPENYYYVKKLF